MISDPGFKLVREVCAAGHRVVALPGPSSVLTALSVAALPTDRFFFEGFLPPKQTARRTRLTELSRLDATLVMFESGSRVQETLADLAAIMGARDAAICREMTKLHEEVNRGVACRLAQSAATLETRGEFVLVIAPRRRRQPDHDAERSTISCASGSRATASRMRSRTRSKSRAGRAAKSMPARLNSPGATLVMAKTDEAKSAKPVAPKRPRPRASRRSAPGSRRRARAAAFLIAKGYRILARRFRTPHGEIDIVARRRHLLVFVEVKARGEPR